MFLELFTSTQQCDKHSQFCFDKQETDKSVIIGNGKKDKSLGTEQ